MTANSIDDSNVVIRAKIKQKAENEEKTAMVFQRARRTIESIRTMELVIRPQASQFPIRTLKILEKNDLAYHYSKEYSIPKRTYALSFLISYHRGKFEQSGGLLDAKNYLRWIDCAFDNSLIAQGNDNYAKLQEAKNKLEELEADNIKFVKAMDNLRDLNQKLSKKVDDLEKELKQAYVELDKGREKKA